MWSDRRCPLRPGRRDPQPVSPVRRRPPFPDRALPAPP
ncbi:MAG: hypothetical protein AVDCRST_MAG27-470 [uncultured Craurococcus sp.]|uniref:Uncharacterized protein n=1 Tax=uncultured Craurococcus sp. TaxID=1135998 RepID=A0A6J4HFW2_9PROT|nr:MAG: hypothetical protein AVDCRST_MAG27-470 [uncultured Craurococcus sp.]